MRYLRSSLPGVRFRRSLLSDAPALQQLLELRDVKADGIPSLHTFGASFARDTNGFIRLLQTSHLCITAVSTNNNDLVVGFIALGASSQHGSARRAAGQSTPKEAVTKSTQGQCLSTAALWDEWLLGTESVTGGLHSAFHGLRPWNTMWINMVIAPPSSNQIPLADLQQNIEEHKSPAGHLGFAKAKDTSATATKLPCQSIGLTKHTFSATQMLRELLTVATGVVQEVAHFLCMIPAPAAHTEEKEGGVFPLLDALGQTHNFSLPASMLDGRTAIADSASNKVRLLHLPRECIRPSLIIRRGGQEDYDDFVQLLLEDVGVVTRLPENFFLEEIFRNQNDMAKVLVAENSSTHEVIGLACLHAIGIDEQHILMQEYRLDKFNGFSIPSLNPSVTEAKISASHNSNAVRIDFLYWNPVYEGASRELLNGIFDAYPMCEFTFIQLPHTKPECALLQHFVYLPIRPFEPYNSRGDALFVPHGLWVCCRYSLEPSSVALVRTLETAAMLKKELLRDQACDLHPSESEKLSADLCLALPAQVPCDHSEERRDVDELGDSGIEDCAASAAPLIFALSHLSLEWPVKVPVASVGLVSVRRVSANELHALRANYDMDQYVYFYSDGGHDYSATDITVQDEGSRHRSSQDDSAASLCGSSAMATVVICGMYVKPIYTGWIRFFVREVLRQCRAEIAIFLPVQGTNQPFAPLVQELLVIQPRRVFELNIGAPVASPHADPAALATLFITTPRCLGDLKLNLHARVVVAGASATALCFLYRLLSIPYVRFTNLVLVSTDGFPLHPNQAQKSGANTSVDGTFYTTAGVWFTDTMELLEREHILLRMGHPIRIVPGKLVDIDKTARFITIDNGTFEPYDYLVLTAGRQYIVPPCIRQLLQQEGRPMSKKHIIPLNNELSFYQARALLKELANNVNNVSNVLVYGSSLDAYSVLTAMVEDEGFSPQRVVVCSREAHTPFMDESSSLAALTVLRSIGVNVLRGYDFSRIEFNEDGGLASVVLNRVDTPNSGAARTLLASQPQSSHSQASSAIELTCGLILCVEDKDMDSGIVSVLNKRSIVLDGRVIIDKQYSTTDPFVLAAGPVSMWTRRYGVVPNAEVFNARDIGYDLARVLMVRLGFEEFTSILEHKERQEDYFGASIHEKKWASERKFSTTFLCKTKLTTTGTMENQDHGDDFNVIAAVNNKNNDDTQNLAEFADTEGTLRKQSFIPTFSTPLARRARFPCDFLYFTVECIGFNPAECEVLTCSNICEPTEMRDRLMVYMEQAYLSSSSKPKPSAAESMNSASGRIPGDALPKEMVSLCSSDLQNVISVYVRNTTCMIDAIRFFGNGKPELHNYMTLAGFPESLLNLSFRFKEAAGRAQQAGQATLPPLSALTAGVLNGQLDLMSYFRLPHLQTIFTDRFVLFFAALRQRMRQHEEFIRVEEQRLAERTHEDVFKPLTADEVSRYVEALSDAKCAFKREVQLALVRFLHETKNFRSKNIYLPNIERFVNRKEPIHSIR